MFLHHTASSRSDQTRATNASCRLQKDYSPFHERLATHQLSKSMSLRRTASSMNSQGRAKHVSHRQSRISSPFHERLATHHTYATESKLLYKMPPSKIIPFYNVVRSAPTKPSFGAPPPTPRTCTSRHRTVPIPAAPRYASNNMLPRPFVRSTTRSIWRVQLLCSNGALLLAISKFLTIRKSFPQEHI